MSQSRISLALSLSSSLVLTLGLWATASSGATHPKPSRHPSHSFIYPIGTSNTTAPSGYAPPAPNALPGYTQDYVTTFPGTAVPSGWDTYNGLPGGDPGGHFASTHIVVSNGVLSINTYQDPAYNNEWVTGGICQCGYTSQTYGAWFERSRLTGPGPTGVALLWPDANVWPPEIDFNETYGGTSYTSATVHWDANNSQFHSKVTANMTQWHTWGVIWTPTKITYILDGRVWGTDTVASEIPTIPMHISLQSQTWCESGWACPSTPQSMQVAWVAEYSPN
jgi:hypothetical protein